jgi:hypothetical protein
LDFGTLILAAADDDDDMDATDTDDPTAENEQHGLPKTDTANAAVCTNRCRDIIVNGNVDG